jgi:hypothetical protein
MMTTNRSDQGPDYGVHKAGCLPPWKLDDLPLPPPLSTRNLLRTIGPGAILLAGSIGGGEWLVGPAVAVQYGTGVFWVATVAILLQLNFNLEAIRYTLYTGEPALSGIMRLRPGPKFWAAFYIILAIAQLGLPALAASCASVIFAAVIGRLPGVADDGAVSIFTYTILLITLLILLFGGTIERMLEYVSWFMVSLIILFLIAVNIIFVPASHWMQTFTGFFRFGHLPAGINLPLLGALAATAGSGGFGNLAISNWIRDKGFGMGGRVGAIASAFGTRQAPLSPVGSVFPINDENLRRWRVWWRYVEVDQIWLWAAGCFLGMFLNINLATYITPLGTDLTGAGAGAYQAQYMAQGLWAGLWFLALLNGFWILFSTHLGNTDILVRTVTDILWVADDRLRIKGNISRIYYTLLIIFVAWSVFGVNWGSAMNLFKVLANVAGLVLAIASVQLLIVQRRFLPASLRAPRWRQAMLIAVAVFYGALTLLIIFAL